VATTADTCDRHPSARAAHAAEKSGLLLTLCGHCASVNADALIDKDWLIYKLDEHSTQV